MRTKTIFILLCILISCMPIKAQNEVEKLVVYKSFWRGGSTARVFLLFKEPVKYSIDTTNINIGPNMFLSEFNSILSETKARKRKHFQQKIAGISIAGEFWFNQSTKHYFIICLPELLIDITDKKEYVITDETLLNQMNDWINSLEGKKNCK